MSGMVTYIKLKLNKFYLGKFLSGELLSRRFVQAAEQRQPVAGGGARDLWQGEEWEGALGQSSRSWGQTGKKKSSEDPDTNTGTMEGRKGEKKGLWVRLMSDRGQWLLTDT